MRNPNTPGPETRNKTVTYFECCECCETNYGPLQSQWEDFHKIGHPNDPCTDHESQPITYYSKNDFWKEFNEA